MTGHDSLHAFHRLHGPGRQARCGLPPPALPVAKPPGSVRTVTSKFDPEMPRNILKKVLQNTGFQSALQHYERLMKMCPEGAGPGWFGQVDVLYVHVFTLE